MTRKKVSNKAKRLSKKNGRIMRGGIGNIQHNNDTHIYRTLHRHPDDCTVFTRVPRGWEVAPGNAHDKDMCKYHDWQYPIIMFGDNSHCVCWSGISIGAQMSTPPIPHLETDGLNEYRTNRKNATILLRRLISEEAAEVERRAQEAAAAAVVALPPPPPPAPPSRDIKLNGKPGHIAFDFEGNLVVVDRSNHCIKIFRNGNLKRTIGREGKGNGQFNEPYGVAFDGAGHIIVSEIGNNRVQVLRYSDGVHVRTIGDRQGSGNGEFDRPSGIAVDGEGNIAVYDGMNCRVQVHRLSDGAYIRTIGSSGSGNGQFGEGLGGVAFDSNGNLVVSNSGNHRVQVLRYSDGMHLRTIGSGGKGAGQFFGPTGVAFDALCYHILVADTYNNRVQVLRYSDGVHVYTFEQIEPYGVAISPDSNLVVSAFTSVRIFPVPLLPPSLPPARPPPPLPPSLPPARPPPPPPIIPSRNRIKLFDRGRPGHIAFDWDNKLVVADHTNNCIQVLHLSDGTQFRRIGSEGSGNGQFNQPWGIAFDSAGHIIVADRGNNRVQVLRYSDGAHVRTIGSEGTGNGQFSRPTGIAVDREGNIAVADRGNHRVQVHRLSDGAYVRTIGSMGTGNGQFQHPTGVAFDGAGNLVVADSGNDRVQVHRLSDGAYVRTIGREGEGVGEFNKPSNVAFDADGHILVVDQGNMRVQMLEYSNGSHVQTFGQIHTPFGGIAIARSGNIMVGESNSNSVLVFPFSLNPLPLPPPPPAPPAPPPPPPPPPPMITGEKPVDRFEEDTKQLFLSKYGDQPLTVHGPCWWHRIDDLERSALILRCRQQPGSPECLGSIYAEPLRLVVDRSRSDDARRSIQYFVGVCSEYSRKTNTSHAMETSATAVTDATTRFLSILEQKEIGSTKTAIPSNFQYPGSGRQLTFCEYAAIYFYTLDEDEFPFLSTYRMLRSSMQFPTVVTELHLSGRQYVDRISERLVTLFFSGLAKCPRVSEISRSGLTSSAHLHRFMMIPQAVFERYSSSAQLGSRVTFYCFQSFSLSLTPENIGPFARINTARVNDKYLILLRIVVNGFTTARYMSHLSHIEREDEVLALPCIPYTVIETTTYDRANFVHFLNFTTLPMFNCNASIGDGIGGFLVITLQENSYPSVMGTDIHTPLNG